MSFGSSFDGVSENFMHYEQTVRSAVRYELVHRNLAPFMRPGMSVLDVCGGSGPDSAWFAEQGSKVTLLEPSQEQIFLAQIRFNDELPAEVSNRITVVEGDLDNTLDDKSYDLVAVHGVAMYKQDPIGYLQEAMARAKPGGLFSALDKGRIAVRKRLQRENAPIQEQISFFETGSFTNNMGRTAQTITPDMMQRLALQNRSEVVHMSGVRVSYSVEKDTRLKNDISHKEWEKIVATEAKHGATNVGMLGAQMLHTIIRKPA